MITPLHKPFLGISEINKLILRHEYGAKLAGSPVFLAAIRGYRLDSMGVPGQNDFGFYDDLACWVWPTGFEMFNYNTDPTRGGWNPNANKFMAVLRPGVYDFVMRRHKGQYAAFGQGSNPVVVDRVNRDKEVMDTERGLFGINIHRGGDTSTSSEGCQTLPQPDWLPFKTLGYKKLNEYKQKTFKYVLFDEKAERQFSN